MLLIKGEKMTEDKKTIKKEKDVREWFEKKRFKLPAIVSGSSSIILFIIGQLANVITITTWPVFSTIWSYLKYVFLVILLVSSIILFIIFSKTQAKFQDMLDDKETVAELEKLICNGNRFKYNEVTVHFDSIKKQYNFVFVKEFEIIDDCVEEFETQFYANKFLNDVVGAKAFYDKNIIKWEDLKVQAYLQFKRGDEYEIEQIPLEIINVKGHGNYIPFKIRYIEFGTNTKITLNKGDCVKLTYSYDVPIKFWGSYINRTVSYFGEKTVIVLDYDSANNLDSRIEILDKNGQPTKISKEDYEQRDNIDGHKTHRIYTIKNHATSHRYRIKWNSSNYFGDGEVDTIDAKDDLGLTDH